MDIFQRSKRDAPVPLQAVVSEEEAGPRQKFPMLNKNMDFSQLVKNPNRIMLCVAMRNQAKNANIDKYFDTYHADSLVDEEVDSFLLTKVFGWSDGILNNPDKDIEIIVGKKFMTNREITANTLEKEREPVDVPEGTSINNDNLCIKELHSLKEGAMFTQFDEFLKLTYENYKKNFDGAAIQEAESQVAIPQKAKKSIYDDEFEMRKSQLNEKLKKTFERRSSVPTVKKSFVEEEEEVDDIFEEVHYLPARTIGPSQRVFSGLYNINFNSKSDKLTASTIASIGGFYNGEDNRFD
jgi:hypothetical protein